MWIEGFMKKPGVSILHTMRKELSIPEFFPTIPSFTDYKIKANNAKKTLVVTFVMVIITPPFIKPSVITCNHFRDEVNYPDSNSHILDTDCLP